MSHSRVGDHAREGIAVKAELGTRLEVLGAHGELLASSVSALEVNCTVGLYRVRATMGGASEERVVALVPEKPHRTLRFDPLALPSAAELLATVAAPTEYAARVTQTVSRVCEHPIPRADASAEVLIVTTVASDSAVAWDGTNPGRDIELLTEDGGTLVAKLREDGITGELDGRPWRACAVRVRPGNYRLRIRRRTGGRSISQPHEVIEQVLVAVHGWRTQVFLELKPEVRGPGVVWLVDPIQTTLSMARPGAFFVADPSLREAEILRACLERRDHLTPRAVLAAALLHEEPNPFVVLLGALALSTSSEVADHSLALDALARVEQSFTLCADVTALMLRYKFTGLAKRERQRVPRVTTPPMCERSWQLILDAPVPPYFVAPVSLAADVAMRRYSSGAWLSWLVLEGQDVARRSNPFFGDEGSGVSAGAGTARAFRKMFLLKAPEEVEPNRETILTFVAQLDSLWRYAYRLRDPESGRIPVKIPVGFHWSDGRGAESGNAVPDLISADHAILSAVLRLNSVPPSAGKTLAPASDPEDIQRLGKELGVPAAAVIQAVAQTYGRLSRPASS